MRLAVISDIHGECFALDQVLQDVRRQGIEQMVCLGDALQGGSQPAETLARLRELHCPVVMGNADAWLITGQETSSGEETSEQSGRGRSRNSQKATSLLSSNFAPRSKSRWKPERSCSVSMDRPVPSTRSSSPRRQMTWYGSSWVDTMQPSSPVGIPTRSRCGDWATPGISIPAA